MTAKIIRWHRSRRNLLIVSIIFMIFVVFYLFINRSVSYEADLVRSAQFVSSTHLKHSSVILDDVTKTLKNTEHKIKSTVNNINNVNLIERSSIVEYIDNTLQEALREEKGMGCEVPKLNPFAKEVTQFDKELPTIVCTGNDWVKCHLSECRVKKDILETKKNIECSYSDIVYESDDKYKIYSPTKVLGEQVYTLTKSDHVKVTCTGIDNKSHLPEKWTGNTLGFRSTVTPKNVRSDEGSHKRYNVLILGFDSTSKNGFIRRMPKSYKVLTEELKAVVLNGYNIVGDGTPAALFPILTGKTELELPESRKSMKGSGHLDAMPFIFYKLADEGYRTAYFEDMPWIGTFQYRFRGFRHQPADHYLRAFYLEQSKEQNWYKGGMNRYCVGETPQYRLMLNITQQFFHLSGKRFGFTFIADITHDDFNMISTADDDVVDFLREFKSLGRLKDTLLLVMGDHGPRYANVRETFQGKLEERLPLMAIILPEDLKLERPDAHNKLLSNVDTLTTPHDIHATVLDVLDMRRYWNYYKVPGADLLRGLTLLETVPKNRSCSEAAIEPHWCACLRWENVSHDDEAYQAVAQALLDHINSITESVRSKCVARTLTSIEWVMRQKANPRMLAFKGAKDNDGYVGKFGNAIKIQKETYQLKMTVGPGRGVYEASMTYSKDTKTFHLNPRDISRINAYGTEPSCISEQYPHLNMFCYCKR